MLVNGGLNSTYNSTIAKLILASNHGMHDKVDTSYSGSLGLIPSVKINLPGHDNE